jgi:hypothetical protein
MATSSNLTGTLRRSLLIKVISKPAPSREDVNSVIELTASKVVESLQAQSMTLYLVEGNEIAFKQVYYSPTLWGTDKGKEVTFRETSRKLLALKLPPAPATSARSSDRRAPLLQRQAAPTPPPSRRWTPASR